MAPWDGVWVFRGIQKKETDFGQAYGDYMLPTASPQVKDRISYYQTNSPLTFVAADPLQCKALQIWPSTTTNEEDSSHIVVTTMPSNDDTASSYAISFDGLDPDVVLAFKRSMAIRTCPTSYQIPNIPGVLASSMTSNYLVFDEYVLEAMSKLGWSRIHGIAKLTPMACALYEHWKCHSSFSS